MADASLIAGTEATYIPDTGPQKITGTEDYDKLGSGTQYIDPEGKTRTKPWTVTDAKSYEAVPEGEHFTDPEGKVRQKPTYEGVDFTTQALYDMTLNDKEKSNVLARAYGKDAVKRDEAGALYVDQGVKRLKPGHGSGLKRAGAYTLAETAPVGGAIAGGLVGGAAGSVEPGGGTVAGGMAGAAGGGAVGQGFNDMILKLAGVYDRSVGAEAGNLAVAGASSAVGEGAGRALTAAVPFAKDAVNSASRALPSSLGKLWGATADPAATQQAAKLASQGVLVPPSAWLKEAPYFKAAVEQFDPAFRQQNVLKQSAETHYQTEADKILNSLGIKKEGRQPVTDATAPVSSEKAGESLIARAHADMMKQDQALDTALAAAKSEAARGIGEGSVRSTAAIADLKEAEAASRNAAQAAIDEGFKSIQTDINAVVKAGGAGDRPGDLMRAAAGKIKALNTAVKLRASKIYDAADVAAGDARPNVTGLAKDAKAFAEDLPEPFRQKYPDVVKALGSLETGKTTFGQLHNLRSLLRTGIDRNDLTPGVRDGAYKFFSGRINQALHDTEAHPALKDAAQILDRGDAFYAKNMPRFHDEIVKGIVSSLKAGMPGDPKVLSGMLFREGQTERMREVRRIVGPNLWSAIRASDAQTMLDASKTLVPGELDGQKFAGEVLDRVRTGVLEAGYDKESAKRLLLQAQRIAAVKGTLPLKALEGDTVASFLSRAESAAKAAEEMATKDPLGTLSKEQSRLDKEFAAQKRGVAAARSAEPLGFLYQASAQAVRSADKILSSPDLLTAAAVRFGEQSSEFTLLRQVGAQRILQRTIDKASGLRTTLSEKITPEAQRLLFPGVTLDAAQALAKDMDFLSVGTMDAGGSMAAKSRVLHPFGSIMHGKLTAPLGAIPGAETVGRMLLGKYYAALTYATTHPAFVQWVAKGLQGPPAEREMVRRSVQQIINAGGAAGAGAGEALNPQRQQGASP